MLRFNKISALQIFQVLQFGTAILIGILLVKAGLPTALVSVYEALMFIASLFCFFWVAGGQNALLQLFAKLDEATQKRAIFNVFLLFSVAGLLAGSLLFIFQKPVGQYLTNFEQLPLLNLLALFLILNSPSFLLQIFYLLLKKYKQLVRFGVVSFGLQLVLVVLPIFLHFSLRETMFGLLVWAFVKLVWCLVVVYRHADWTIDPVFLKKYLLLAWPLLLFAAIGKGSEYVSGLAVTTLFEDEKAFAIFRYGARELPIAVLMVGALATALIPELAENQSLGLERIKSNTRRLSHWLFPISMASMLAAPFLFPFFFNQDFKASAQIFNIFTLLLASRILLPQVVTMGAGKNKILILSALAELVVLVLLSFWWGSSFGLLGVAWAAVVAFMVDRVLLIWYNWRVLKIHPSSYVDWKIWIGYNLLLIATFLISTKL
ncbi:MAG: oligosaccharide flippase family protein [Saprospiraceae bacterium]|nr:oligosaccharide flippase family protein [Saprospiraceae bacterium]MCF8248890.1 oligosaccharide flippase family protein [Saprospiraceae bacterium]MCF8279615.1 oligosaccharide flippase family protein [Bacteroidales bacterium]MCF8310175.1 oligosaccharide flippase family protein [Saprospiraceae bacterium]MCF8439075.1 oligosaccharide flippase family protein [Saprospiraceae bacterium]